MRDATEGTQAAAPRGPLRWASPLAERTFSRERRSLRCCVSTGRRTAPPAPSGPGAASGRGFPEPTVSNPVSVLPDASIADPRKGDGSAGRCPDEVRCRGQCRGSRSPGRPASPSCCCAPTAASTSRRTPPKATSIVSVVALMNVVLGLAASIAALRGNNVRVLLLALSFVSMAGIFAIHGLSTPGFLVGEEYNEVTASRARPWRCTARASRAATRSTATRPGAAAVSRRSARSARDSRPCRRSPRAHRTRSCSRPARRCCHRRGSPRASAAWRERQPAGGPRG